MSNTDNIQNLQIKAKKISAIDTFPNNYSLEKKDNNYILLSYLEDNNTRRNYKISLEQIISFMCTKVSEGRQGPIGKSVYDIYLETLNPGETPLSEREWINSMANTEKLNALKNEIIQLINSYHTNHTITYNLTNVINDNNPTLISGRIGPLLKFNNAVGYVMPDTVTVTGAEYDYDKDNKTINLIDVIDNVIVTINATDKLVCTFDTTEMSDMIDVSLLSQNGFVIDDIFTIKLSLHYTGNNTYKLPSQINCVGCTVISYNQLTGEAILKCDGTHKSMTISGDAIDYNPYIFSYAIESDSNIFTLSNNIITEVNFDNLKTLPYTINTNGTCGFDFNNGIVWDTSVDVIGNNVWVIMPSKYFVSPNIIIDDYNNKYVFTDVFGNAMSSIKNIVTLNYYNIEYTLFNISNNGVTGIQNFKQIETENYIEDTLREAKSYTNSKLGDIGDTDVKSYIDTALNSIMGEDWQQSQKTIKDIIDELTSTGNNDFDTVVDKIRDDFTYGETGTKTTDVKHYIDGKVADSVTGGTIISDDGILTLG